MQNFKILGTLRQCGVHILERYQAAPVTSNHTLLFQTTCISHINTGRCFIHGVTKISPAICGSEMNAVLSSGLGVVKVFHHENNFKINNSSLTL